MRNRIAEHFAQKKVSEHEPANKFASTLFTTDVYVSDDVEIPSWTPEEQAVLADKVIESIREVLFIGADGLRSQDHRPEFVDAKAVAVSLMKFVCLLTELEIANKLEKSPRGVYLLVAKAQAAMTDQNPRNELQQKILRVRDHLLLELESLDPN